MAEHELLSDNRRTDLKERAERILGLSGVHKDLKEKAKQAKEQIDAAYKDAGSVGYSRAQLRKVISELQMDADERQAVFDFEDETNVYRLALGIARLGEQIVHEMTDAERSEASLRIAAGQDAATAVKATVGKRKTQRRSDDEDAGA